MCPRISAVGSIQIISLDGSTTFNVGDSIGITPKARGLAVHRDVASFRGNEGDFNHPLFYEPIPRLVVGEKMQMKKFDHFPFIKVGSVEIISAGSAAVIQIGSTRFIDTESRTRHVRQFFKPPLVKKKGEF